MKWIQGPISVSFYEHGNETPSSIKGTKFLEELRDRQLSATLLHCVTSKF